MICGFVICAELTGLSVKTGITNGLGQQFCNGSELRYLGKAGHEADLASCSQDQCLTHGLCSACFNMVPGFW